MSLYRYSSNANADIEEIVLYIFDLNPVAAHRFLDSLEGICELLASIHCSDGHVRSLAKDFVRIPSVTI
jgi:plasmid stabilization system protein ParE